MAMKHPCYKQRIARDFSASAKEYDEYAYLQRQVLALLSAMPENSWQGKTVLDAGTGTGMLAEYWPQAKLIGMDIAEGMCREAKARMAWVIAGDMEQLPLQESTVEGVISSLALQWVEQPYLFFAEAYRICRPGGWLRIATLGSATLTELRQAYLESNLSPPLLNFLAQQDLLAKIQQAGWKIDCPKREMITTQHANLRELLRYLKKLGARQKKPQKSMRHRHDLERLSQNYPSKEAEKDEIKASWEVLIFTAGKPL